MNLQANKSHAAHICSQSGGFLPYSDSYNDYSKLKEYMRANGIQQSWLGIKKINYKTAHWIDLTQVGMYWLLR